MLIVLDALEYIQAGTIQTPDVRLVNCYNSPSGFAELPCKSTCQCEDTIGLALFGMLLLPKSPTPTQCDDPHKSASQCKDKLTGCVLILVTCAQEVHLLCRADRPTLAVLAPVAADLPRGEAQEGGEM